MRQLFAGIALAAGYHLEETPDSLTYSDPQFGDETRKRKSGFSKGHAQVTLQPSAWGSPRLALADLGKFPICIAPPKARIHLRL